MNVSERTVCLLSLTATLAACGGGGIQGLDLSGLDLSGLDLSGIAIQPEVPANPGGVWVGTFASQDITIGIEGVITEDTKGHFVDENGTQYVVTGIGGSGNIRGVTFDAYAQGGFQFLDGSTVSSGNITGTVVERSTFSGSYSFSTGESGEFSMTYDSVYDRGSSLTKLSGTWDEGFGILTVDPNGVFFEQDQFGCVYNGEVSIIDTMFNAYHLTMTVSNCGMDDGDYDGIGVLADLIADGDENLFVVRMNSLELIFAAAMERL